MVTNTDHPVLTLCEMAAWNLFNIQKLLWPKVRIYDRQAEIIRSVTGNDVTAVPAANKLGKDFVAGLIAVCFFLSRRPARVYTTSVDEKSLKILWDEIHRFIQRSEVPLDYKKGGPLQVNDREIYKLDSDGQRMPMNSIIGRVAAKGEGMLGAHANPFTLEEVAEQEKQMRELRSFGVGITGDALPHTMLIVDECSGVEDVIYDMGSTWAERILLIGNTWSCENFWKKAVDGDPINEDPGGDVPRKGGRTGFYRKVIRMDYRASPNIRLALKEKEAGQEPSRRTLVPGVKGWDELQMNLELWDEAKQEVSLFARFPKDGAFLLYPQAWLDRAHEIADKLDASGVGRVAKAIAIDAAEGGDDTTFTATDELGVIEQEEHKTKDTNNIPGLTIAFGRRHNVAPENWIFDVGGGGKQHADRLRASGYNVRVVNFGDSATVPEVAAKQRMITFRPAEQKIAEEENRTVFKNRRAEMYWIFSQLLNPTINPRGFGIPRKCRHLYTQLKPIPRTYDDEGRFYVVPKGNRYDPKDPKKLKMTIFKLLGRSPDHADGAVMATYCMLRKVSPITAGAM